MDTADLALRMSVLDDQRVNAIRALALRFETAIFDGRLRRRPKLRPGVNFLNLGAGRSNGVGEWHNADLPRAHDFFRRKRLPDWMMDAARPWRCPSDVWDGIFCEHMIEHLPYTAALRVLTEALRTLKPGGWFRIVIPDLRRFVDNYVAGGTTMPDLGHPAFAFSYLTQSWGHISVWDADLLSAALRTAGFIEVKEVQCREGNDARLLKDYEGRRWESAYVEGQKPPR